MRILAGFLLLGGLLQAPGATAQEPPFGPTVPKEETDRKLPNGKSQKEEILKEDYEKSLKDAAQLVELSQALQKELESGGAHVLSVSMLKKAEEIEKIAKRVHGRLRRF